VTRQVYTSGGQQWTEWTAEGGSPGRPPASGDNPLVPAKGAHFGSYNGDMTTDTSPVTAFEGRIGRRLGIVPQYHDFSPGQEWPTPPEQAACGAGTGRILLISNDLRIYRTGTYIQCADIAAGKYDAQITDQAQQVAAWGVDCLYAFQAEPDNSTNRNVYSTGGPAQYVAAWRHAHSLWQAAGAVKAQWVWCMTGANTASDQALYPGNDVVDWLGWDPYLWGFDAWSTAASKWGTYLTWLNKQGSYIDLSKPRIICETGADTGTWTAAPHRAADWIAGFPAAAAACGVSAVCLFDRNEGANADWLIDGTPAALAAYAAAGADPQFNPA
jgi:hypothetical protein